MAKKSQIIPNQDFVFLGCHYLTSQESVVPTPDSVERFLLTVHKFSGVRPNVLSNGHVSFGPDVLKGGPGTNRKLVDAATPMATSKIPFANEHSWISARPDTNERRKIPSATYSAK